MHPSLRFQNPLRIFARCFIIAVACLLDLASGEVDALCDADEALLQHAVLFLQQEATARGPGVFVDDQGNFDFEPSVGIDYGGDGLISEFDEVSSKLDKFIFAQASNLVKNKGVLHSARAINDAQYQPRLENDALATQWQFLQPTDEVNTAGATKQVEGAGSLLGQTGGIAEGLMISPFTNLTNKTQGVATTAASARAAVRNGAGAAVGAARKAVNATAAANEHILFYEKKAVEYYVPVFVSVVTLLFVLAMWIPYLTCGCMCSYLCCICRCSCCCARRKDDQQGGEDDDDDDCQCCDLDALWVEFCYQFVSAVGLLPAKKIKLAVAAWDKARRKPASKRRQAKKQASLERTSAVFITRVLITVFCTFMNAALWVLWALGWMQSVLTQVVCYLLFILAVGVPAFACLLPLLLFLWRNFMTLVTTVNAIEAHLFGAAALFADKAEDVTDYFGITECSDSDEEEANEAGARPEDNRPQRNMFSCGCASQPGAPGGR